MGLCNIPCPFASVAQALDRCLPRPAGYRGSPASPQASGTPARSSAYCWYTVAAHGTPRSPPDERSSSPPGNLFWPGWDLTEVAAILGTCITHRASHLSVALSELPNPVEACCAVQMWSIPQCSQEPHTASGPRCRGSGESRCGRCTCDL